MVERFHGMEEVVSSSLIASTFKENAANLEVCGGDDRLILNLLLAWMLIEMHRPLELRALPLASASSHSDEIDVLV